MLFRRVAKNWRWATPVAVALFLAVALKPQASLNNPVAPVALAAVQQQLSGGTRLEATAVGHQFRQDDWPQVAAAADGSIWVTWLSFDGSRDDIGLRRFSKGNWQNLQWVPGASGDAWMPGVAPDATGGVWVVWSQKVKENWDIYARHLDPAAGTWGSLQRLSSDALPDTNPRVWSDGKGGAAVVWQGFRGKHSNIFLSTLAGDRWSSEIRITNRAANDWEPAVVLDAQGLAWVAYDSYKNGNYDIFLTPVTNGQPGKEIPAAATPRFEAKPTLAIDSGGRLWVAWESGPPNWGKDTGFVIFDRQPGTELGGARSIMVRCHQNNGWTSPAHPAGELFPSNDVYQPQIFSDGAGSIWLAVKKLTTITRKDEQRPERSYYPPLHQVYWEYLVTRLEGGGWRQPFTLPNSKGRPSTRIGGALTADRDFWLVWPTDNRKPGALTRALREEVYAARVPERPSPASPALAPAVDLPVEVKPGHADEAGDLRAIGAYTATVAGRKLRIMRGDFHRHTDLSLDRGGSPDGSLQDFYRYMFDAGAMDFGASTDHSNGMWPYWTWYAQKMTDMFLVPGTYVPIFGYERSAAYPDGHRNIFYARRADYHVTPFFSKPGSIGLPRPPAGDDTAANNLAANDTKLMYEDIRAGDGLAISHTSGAGGGTDWRDNDPYLEPVVEIFQGCRNSYEQLGAPFVTDPARDIAQVKRNNHYPKGMVSEAWKKGYKLGVIASSDHFSTHMSYAMVYTDDPSRAGILAAFRKRHTYGATDNIILDVRMGDCFMGDEAAMSRPAPLRVKARGTRPIVRVDIIKDGKVIYSVEPRKQDVAVEYTDRGDIAGKHYYYVRLQQDDQMIAWSSPMFINYGR